ncbi:P-loop containing nucleoside triphosphate hydrolase protein [Crucibulum laeve]|uniref:P-loop containing nucleoside triphosphate hydrolase protein n=1 Tax=Crucibulum laeve TaxID=68775 RepID=A0A5C3LKE2_9AGAR|nr:P-loop containing nucleoside triphosphate hydrolase protein [Crucibulum laeve]
MPKRRATVDSDNETQSIDTPTLPSKRARTAENSEDEDIPSKAHPKREQKANGKGKARQVDSDEESSEEDEGVIDDEEFEKENAAKLRAHLESKRTVQGGIAEHGIIESIEMHQFMCHKYLTFTFGPQVNFIIGHNGSGKSAVLSAITVALGGKANSTGRGNGLKSFIREGQSVSEVTICLKNQGDEAYKPKEYGKSIFITRRFTKEGSSTWKIKSKDGRIISTKKDELAAICDHMNIQVDNPMTVLTQDAARQFLSASHPQDKYKFFLRGTQLSQLSDEYDTCLENITQTAKVLAQKKEALPDLKVAYRESAVRYDEAQKAREQKKKVDDLKKELAWAHVKTKEMEMEKKFEEVARATRRLPKIEENLAKVTAEVETASEEVTRLEAEFRGLGDINDLVAQRENLQTKMRANKTKLSEYNADINQMNVSITASNNQIKGLQKQIDEETRRLATHTQARHEELQRKIEAAREEVHTAEQIIQRVTEERKQYAVQCDTTKAEGVEKERKKAELQQKITECDNMIQRCMQQEKDSLAPYGRDIKRVLETIDKMRWAGDKPLGPLGVHVKAKDPKTWGEVLRNQLGGYLTAFAVTDARDQKQLKKLLVDSQNSHVLIIIYEKDLFDYRSGEPADNYPTVLRALDISDPYVLRILINQARIERQLLSKTRKEGQAMLQGIKGGGNCWSADGFGVRVFPEGGTASTPLNFRTGNDAMNLLLTGRDTASEIQHYRAEKQEAEAAYLALNQSINALKSQFNQARSNFDRLRAEEQKAQEAQRVAKFKVTNLQQEANDDLPVGIAGFEAAKEEAEAEKANVLEQFKAVQQQKAALDEVQRSLMTQINEYKQKIDNFREEQQIAEKKVEDAVAVRIKAQSDKRHFEKKLADEKKVVAELEDAAKLVQQEFENWTEKAEAYCAKVENPRKVEDVQRNLDSITKALKDREKRQGASVEELMKELNKAKERLEKADKELKQMSMLNKALKASLIVRLARWQEFRRHIALRCKLVFQYHLSHRGYFGKVLFNHEQGTLTLKVQTDDQIATQGSRDKDPRSLSGGEKSFSTICLLLSLWESIGCPLRCLDEFDVFMDAVNRRISMKMMIDTANSSDKKQYILITPQDMTNINFGPTVRVHRMTDPERGNGVLAFAG